MDLEVAFGAWTSELGQHAKDMGSKLDKLVPFKPLHKQALSGAVQIGAVAPASALIEIAPHVPVGRVWNVTAVSIFGPDGHTAVAGAKVDIYGGALLASSATVGGGALSDIIISAAVVPSVNFVPDKAIWLHQDETIYGLIYSSPASTNYVLTARVSEWPVEAVESLVI